MKKLLFLFTNNSRFTLEIPEGTTLRERVRELSAFVNENETHVETHKKVFASGTRVKFPTSRGFFVGYQDGDGAIQTLITPDSKAIKYRGKALLLDELATELEFRVNNLTVRPPYTLCLTGYTDTMQKSLDQAQAAKDRAAERKALAAG